MANPSILLVKTCSPLCPVVGNITQSAGGTIQSRKVWYDRSGTQLYPPATEIPPVILSDLLAYLVVEISIPAQWSGSVRLSAFCDNEVLTKPLDYEVVQGEARTERLLSGNIVAPQLANGANKPIPWVLRGALTVVLGKVIKNGPVEMWSELVKQRGNMTVYVLSRSLPEFYVNRGVPKEMLDFPRLLPVWSQDTSTNWPAFVVTQIFNDPRLEYEVFNGSTKYTSWKVAEEFKSEQLRLHGVAIDCWLDLWLSDLNGLERRGDTKSKYAMNCYDLAAVAQSIILLATPPDRCRVALLGPYGYLKECNLIGRKEADPARKKLNPQNLCNNPSYGSPGFSNLMMCAVNDSTRSKFDNHMFLTYDDSDPRGPKVLDAGVGPHTGQSFLPDYITTAIDNMTTLYATDQNVYKAKSSSGKLGNLVVGPGVMNLAQTSLFAGQDSMIKQGDSLFAALIQKFGGGKLEEPYLGAMTDKRGLVATWTFQPAEDKDKDKPDTIVLNIIQYKEDATAKDEWKRRTLAIDRYQSTDANSGFSDAGTGGFCILTVPHTFQIATIESRTRKSKDLATYVANVRTILKGLKPLHLPGYLADTMEATMFTTAKVDKEFEFKIAVDHQSKGFWSCYEVDIIPGNAILLGATLDLTQTITFKFLARAAGSSSAYILTPVIQTWTSQRPRKGQTK